MDVILQIVVLLIFLRFFCRLSFFQSFRSIVLGALLVAIISYLLYPFVIEQSGDFYTTLLTNSSLVENIAVLITLGAIVGMLLSVGLLNTLFATNKRTIFDRIKFLPDLLIIGAILYAEQNLFYHFPGYKFNLIAIFIAIILSLAVGSITYVLRRVLPEKGSRYELNFLINMLLLVTAIILNAGLSSYNSGSYESNVEWYSVFAFLVLILIFTLLGFMLGKLKFTNKKIKKLSSWI